MIKALALRFESAATVLARASSTLKQQIVKTPGKDWNPGTFLIPRISRLKHSNLWISNMAYLSHSTSISPKFQTFEITKLNGDGRVVKGGKNRNPVFRHERLF